jgi:hypothetical protein
MAVNRAAARGLECPGTSVWGPTATVEGFGDGQSGGAAMAEETAEWASIIKSEAVAPAL